MGTMQNYKIYIEPLGMSRGLTTSEDCFRELNNSKIYYSALKIIFKDQNKLEQEIVLVNKLDEYLSKLSNDKKVKILSLLENLDREREPLKLKGGLEISFDKPIIQGVLNITPDSFSDGGIFNDFGRAIEQVDNMIDNGATIIDVGGESTKPGAKPVSIEEEINRVLPVIKAITDKNNIPVSIDSRNSIVMREALNSGAHIINDVSALEHDAESLKVAQIKDVPIILMHAQGSPETMQEKPDYKCVFLEIYDYLEERIKFCTQHGISKNKIIVDPGIGFGKTVEHNVQILKHIAIFHGLGVPLLIGVSRKIFIGEISGEKVAANRVYGSIAAAQYCLDHGVQIVRVHDVQETKQALSVLDNIHSC